MLKPGFFILSVSRYLHLLCLLCIGTVHAQYQLHIPDIKRDTLDLYPQEIAFVVSEVVNIGDQPSPQGLISSYYYLSNDKIFDERDIFLGFDEVVTSLKPQQRHYAGKVLELLEYTDTGNYFLIQHTYLNTTTPDHTILSSLTKVLCPVKVYENRLKGEKAELMAIIAKVNDTIIEPGGTTISKSYTKNIGAVDTDSGKAFHTFYLLFPDGSTDTTEAIRVGAEIFTDVMKAKARGVYMDEVVSIPKDLPQGRYQLYLIVDPNGSIEEQFEHNNLQYFTDIVVKIPWWKHPIAYSIYTILLIAVGFWLATNIRRRIKLRKELLQQKREAERMMELDAFKTRLYTNLTHEFRTPLTLILGMAERLSEEEILQGSQEYETAVSIIRRNGGRLLQLINQLLDLAKLDSNRLTLNYVQGDVIPYFRYLVESFHSFAQMKNIEVSFQTELDEFSMDYDPERLQQVLSNLISNAIKFTPEHGKVDVSVQLDKSDDNKLLLQVKDSGKGMPKELLPYIFNRFYQVDSTTTRAGEGTGIGLALTKELVELMNGSISVESELNKGSVFNVYLEVNRNAPSIDLVQSETGLGNRLTPGQYLPLESEDIGTFTEGEDTDKTLPLLLVIEDNKDVSHYIATCLKEKYQLAFAYNGQDGIDKAIELVPDLIISDVMMPLKDGFEVCESVKENEKTSHIPIVMLTAKATLTDRIEGIKKGADAYLSKPFEKEELMAVLENLIQLRERLKLRYSNLEAIPPAEDQQIRQEDEFLLKINRILEEHLADPDFSIQHLAEEAGMSRTQLHRKLKALTGKTSQLYVRSIKLRKAKILLLSGKYNVSEVAYEVGFTDPNYFSRAFDKEFGMRPSSLKK